MNQTVPLDPNTKKYRLRFWIKTKDFPAEAMAGAVISWNKPKDVPGFGNQWAFVGFEASDWRKLQRVVHIESTDNRATVKFFATRKEASSLPDKGTFWFDDFELIPLKDKSAGRAWQPPAGFKPVEAAARLKAPGTRWAGDTRPVFACRRAPRDRKSSLRGSVPGWRPRQVSTHRMRPAAASRFPPRRLPTWAFSRKASPSLWSWREPIPSQG